MRDAGWVIAILGLAASAAYAEQPWLSHEADSSQTPAAVPADPVKPAARGAAAPDSNTSAAAPQSSSTAASAATSSTNSPPAEDTEAKAKAIDKRLRSRGYKPSTRDGVVLYCRSETQLGSRFQKQVCGSPESLDDATQTGKDVASHLQRNSLDQKVK